MQYETKKIGGIECIFAPMQESNSLTIDITIKAGSEYETKEEAGISHVLEHMFFKGGKKRKTPQAVAIALDQMGAESNAGTGGNTTTYYIKSAPQYAGQALEILADMLIDAQFLSGELEREKEVIIQELKMYEDNPLAVLNEKRSNFFFGDTSYGRPIIGYEHTIRSFQPSNLFAYKESLYTKDNLLITIAGKIEDQTILETQIEKLFSPLPEKRTRKKPEFKRNLPEKKSDFFSKKTEQNHLIITMPGFTAFEKERYPAKILTTILGGNMSSKLLQEIREKLGLCYYIGAGHAAGEEYGLFNIRAGLDKQKFAFGKESITTLLNTLITTGIKADEFEHAKRYLKGSLQMGIESSDQMASFLASQWLTYREIITLEEFLEKYEKVNLEEVQTILPNLAEEKRWNYWIE